MELTKALRLALEEAVGGRYTQGERWECVEKHLLLRGAKPGVTDPRGCKNPDCAFCDALSDFEHFHAIHLQMARVIRDPSVPMIELLIKLLSYDQAGNKVDEDE